MQIDGGTDWVGLMGGFCILDFSFGGRTENGHEMALELLSGADFSCILHNR